MVAVGVGGAAGTVARYLVIGTLFREHAPFGTLIVNVVGSFLLGFLVPTVIERSDISLARRALLTAGFCGGFTTFSTFSYDASVLLRAGDVRGAAWYVTGTVVVSIGGAVAGMLIGTAQRKAALAKRERS